MAAEALLGSVAVPGDKSCTHRALLIGSVAEGRTEVSGALRALDTLATAQAVARLGARVEWGEGGALAVEGTEAPRALDEPLDCRNAGTAARLLLGLLAGRSGRWTLTGDDSLRRRPMGRVVRPLRAMGADIEPLADGDAMSGGAGSGELRLPLVVRGRPLRGGRYAVALPSAQVKSALLLAGLTADGPLTVEQHVPTRDHTERMLAAFGVAVERAPGATTVRPGRPRGALLSIPGDPAHRSSSATKMEKSVQYYDPRAEIGGSVQVSRVSLGTRLRLLSAANRGRCGWGGGLGLKVGL